MSIKRTRDTRRRPSEGDSSYVKQERAYNWDSDVAARPADSFLAYAPANRYSKDDLLSHKVFGKGIVTNVEGSKIEVLFQAGPKKLAQTPTGPVAPKAEGVDQPEQTA